MDWTSDSDPSPFWLRWNSLSETQQQEVEQATVEQAAVQNEATMKELRIVAAAIVKPDGTQVWLPPPARHHDVARKIVLDDGEYDDGSAQGFRVNDGSFASRETALVIATKAGQIVARCGGDHIRLYSENLW
jgi:hypothetical protein